MYLESSFESFDQLSAPISSRVELETSHFRISFKRKTDGVSSYRVECCNEDGDLLGKISFKKLGLEEAGQLTETLLGLKEADRDLPEYLSEIERLNAALKFAEQNELRFKSDLGRGAVEVVSEFGDRVTAEIDPDELAALIEVTEVSPGIIELHYPTEYLLSASFIRLQEHFESPEEQFRGNTFTLEEYKTWYSEAFGDGNFTYYKDWGGFNVPDYILEPFVSGGFGDLNSREQALLSVVPEQDQKFYLIGTSGDNHAETQRHEIAHGMFYLNAEYRKEVLKIIEKIETTELEEYLRGMGYAEGVIEDECHAYLIDPLKNLKEDGVTVTRGMRRAHKKLNKLLDSVV